MIKNYYGNNLQLDELAREMKQKLILYKEYQEDAMEYYWAVEKHVPDEDVIEHEKHMKEVDEIMAAISKLIVE